LEATVEGALRDGADRRKPMAPKTISPTPMDMRSKPTLLLCSSSWRDHSLQLRESPLIFVKSIVDLRLPPSSSFHALQENVSHVHLKQRTLEGQDGGDSECTWCGLRWTPVLCHSPWPSGKPLPLRPREARLCSAACTHQWTKSRWHKWYAQERRRLLNQSFCCLRGQSRFG